MTTVPKKSKWLDFASVGLSGLCVVHCLALPLLAAVLPLAGALAHDPWVHPLLVLIAAPLSLSAIHTSRAWRKLPVVGLILAGLTLLALAAFVPALENVETLLSVTGALAIAGAHWVNYRSQHRHASTGHGHTPDCACEPAAE
ncbi:MerC domain-containing protein [Asticcacaulis sp. EMRT-3]|uniref:MerC domain-containing protein n=1 Tax=Asticcacaulis sp. EMRT-3 TaxID=3040349 RepID=UPI0024AF194C|nr:MerC domain-containing protein [Asticcacaulis sp. EMRT-3]MDI7776104.1 MerC domain-containing protein [Asticcacaulis sp. EMRT-3]